MADTDSDGMPDYLDLDSNADNLLATDEYFRPSGIPANLDLTDSVWRRDFDEDGVPDLQDTDSDNDGIEDRIEDHAWREEENSFGQYRYYLAYRSTDSDLDSIPDAIEGIDDIDEDGVPNYLDWDSDGDGYSDKSEGVGDFDNNGIPNFMHFDSDGDSNGNDIDDAYEPSDHDHDGIPDPVEIDTFLDPDSDDDGIPDIIESGLNIVPSKPAVVRTNYQFISLRTPDFPDCNKNGIDDAIEVSRIGGRDANLNGIDDRFEQVISIETANQTTWTRTVTMTV